MIHKPAHPRLRTLALLAFSVSLLLSARVEAARLVAVVSERSAEEVLAGARLFLARQPGHEVVLRSVDQLRGETDVALASLLRSADGVLVGAVFREDAARLVRVLERHPPRPEVPWVALASDLSLTRRSRIAGAESFAGLDDGALRELSAEVSSDGATAVATRRAVVERYPQTKLWLEARSYWHGRGAQNFAGLFAWLLSRAGQSGVEVPAPIPPSLIELELAGERVEPRELRERPGPPVIAVLDYDASLARRSVHDALCAAIAARGQRCLLVLAKWGASSARALEALANAAPALELGALVSLQGFVIGGGEARDPADAALARLDVPVLTAIVLHDRTEGEWRLSSDGVPHESIHYRIAMPELQGLGQSVVVATAGDKRRDPDTGLEHAPIVPLQDEIAALVSRIERWRALRRKPNAEKRVAIVYYNHPPGRHNVGADNLDVPESLNEILGALRKAGYRVDGAPAGAAELMRQIQARGVNLPEHGSELARMADIVPTLSAASYRRYFESLPPLLQAEVTRGPTHALTLGLGPSLTDSRARALLEKRLQSIAGDVRHLLEGVTHPARERALDLLSQLERSVAGASSASDREAAEELSLALERTGIAGLRGWGEPPGNVMVHADRIVLPSLEFGNVLIGPQPPRGWEVDEELLHANLAFAPPHQYLAFYHYLRDVWRADVVIHLGRHSTYEFLPGHRTGLPLGDASREIISDLPSVYPYIVDGVGEGIQAKRRGQAVIIDHLTPPLSTTPLYDQLLELRQLVESYEAHAGDDPRHLRAAVTRIRALIGELHLEQALAASMQRELDVRGIRFEQVDDELLVHEVGHYLTELQERFMPFGLHVFGRGWSQGALDTMTQSMLGSGAPDSDASAARVRAALEASPAAEMRALLAALDGRFVAPGPGNDPVRTPDALPTGRNFHALDHSVLPTRLSFALGEQLAREALASAEGTAGGAEAVVLWASDTVRDEGAMVGFGLSLLGVRPTWNSRGIVNGIERDPLEGDRIRRDASFVTSGLFRDLYADLLGLLDRAVLLALDGASQTIERQHPALTEALAGALEPLGGARSPGNEPLSVNQVASHWVEQTSAALAAGATPRAAGRQSSYRVFGNAPGGYGAGINRLAERSGSWTHRTQLAAAYVRRMGHAYGQGLDGAPAHGAFERVLSRTEHTYLGRASNLYGLLDNNDGFDYLGGLGLAVESVRGEPPLGRVVQHANPKQARLDTLPEALFAELRGRHLNPKHLEALMRHDYAGARSMSQAFLENLWGWQVVSPELVEPWVWDETKRVFFDDAHQLGLDEFLSRPEHVHVQINMLAIHLVAADKGFWQPDETVLRELATTFVQKIAEHGLPGSGHTRPDHPVMDFARRWGADGPEKTRFEEVLARAQRAVETHADPSVVAEIEELEELEAPAPWPWIAAGLLALGTVGLGMRRGLGHRWGRRSNHV